MRIPQIADNALAAVIRLHRAPQDALVEVERQVNAYAIDE